MARVLDQPGRVISSFAEDTVVMTSSSRVHVNSLGQEGQLVAVFPLPPGLAAGNSAWS